MDHLERQRKLRRELAAKLVAGLVVLLITATACVADDQTTASLDGGSDGETTLPSTTASTGTDDEDADNDDGETSSTTAPATTTPTTEPLDPLLGLDAQLIADGFDQPILVTGAPGTEALFVVEREGVIWTVENGVRSSTPFLDLTDQLLSSSIEQGLLGLAFHPDYADNGRLFAYWTDPEGDSRLAEFTASDPTTTSIDSLQVILEVDQPAERHNAGMIQFGPKGLLYLALGDGGSGGDTAQDTSNLLGSIVRIDVDNPDGDRPYSIPADNPFGTETWVFGLRNPWRFSIDPTEELMYIGDVGQEKFEEINVLGLDGAGTNFGWIAMEGDRCFRSGCDPESYTLPTLQYSHDEGCSVTGGWVYRGASIPEFNGHYFFGDWCKGWVRSFRYDAAADTVADQFDWTEDLAELGQVTSFGVDNTNELYAVNWDGELYKLVALR